MFYGTKVESSFLDLSSIAQSTINVISWPLTAVTDILYPIWSLIIYPTKWCFGYLPEIDIPDSKINVPNISVGLNDLCSWQKKDPDETPGARDDTSYNTTELENDVNEQEDFNKGKNIIINNKTAKKIAYQHGRKTALRKYKSIGAASVTPKEITAAHIQGREDVLTQHKLKGAASITPNEISEAFSSGKEQRKKEEFEKGFETTQQIQENVQNAINIALLRIFLNQTGDVYIIEKAMFNIKLNQCLKQQSQDSQCLDKSISAVNITSSENILSDNKFEHILLAQNLLNQMPEHIPYKKWFCDLMLKCQNNHDTLYCLEKTQTITGLSYTNDDFCPPS